MHLIQFICLKTRDLATALHVVTGRSLRLTEISCCPPIEPLSKKEWRLYLAVNKGVARVYFLPRHWMNFCVSIANLGMHATLGLKRLLRQLP